MKHKIRGNLVSLLMAIFIISIPVLGVVGPADGGGLPPLGMLKPAGPLLIKSGQKLAFMGDSITDFGDDMPGGYCRLVIDMLRQYGVDVTPAYAGHGGDRSVEMLARLDKDVLAQKPDWMTLSCGVNDAWYSFKVKNNLLDKLVPLEKFGKNVTEIVDKCEKAGTKVILLTPTMIGEEPNADDNKRMEPYVRWMLDFAKARKLPVADLNSLMHEAVKFQPFPGKTLVRIYTSDGVHMNPRGFRMMARGLLRMIGFTDTEISTQCERWMDMPRGWIVCSGVRQTDKMPDGKLQYYSTEVVLAITPRQYMYLETCAAPRGPNLMYHIPKERVIPALLKDKGGSYDSIKEIVTSPESENIQKRIQADSDRLLADEVSKARVKFEQYLGGLSDAKRAEMEESFYR